MFKHRLSKFSKASLLAMCMLLVGGSFQSCEDDYIYDDKEPKWLGASIYDFLKTGSPGHSYNKFVELIDSLDEKETLAHTGSKTLFVADDAAFERFFADNPWGVKSISEMSKAQMKYLFYSSMLDNALLLDMLSSSGSTAGDDGEGDVLRSTTSFSVIDSIPLVKGEDMPVFNKFWDALRGPVRDANLHIAMDGSETMMVHFLNDYLKKQTIKASDIEFLFKKSGVQTKTYTNNEALIYNRKVVASGISTDGFSDDTLTITCKNGYVYRLDDVLLPPSNMADELRKREDTRVFSRLLDRYCIPVFNSQLTARYKAYYGKEDSIFSLRYLTTGDEHGLKAMLTSKKVKPDDNELLPFDPGQNAFGGRTDMAALLVPNDEAFFDYFTTGSGSFLLKQFASSVEIIDGDYDALMQALDSIPEINVTSLLYNLMQPSFIDCVPSKFDKVKDDASDEMGIKEDDVDECVIANNGVIYILNNVFGPADYRAVLGPTKVFNNMLMARYTILQFRYDYYLKAMDAEYSFIVPDDNYFVYHDPVTRFSAKPTVFAFHVDKNRPKGNGQTEEMWAEKYGFNKDTYVVADSVVSELGPISGYATAPTGSQKPFNSSAFMRDRMNDIMEYLIIVHDDGDGVIRDDGTLNPRKYYQTKGYGTMKIDTSDPNAIKFYGGEQIENGTAITIGTQYKQDNGYTFCTVPYDTASLAPGRMASAVPTPPTKSVYRNILAHGKDEADLFYEFSQLSMPDTLDAVMAVMFPDAKPVPIKKDSMRLYSIFYNSTNGREPDGKLVNIVPFFNTFHYTVYVPSNEAIKEMIEMGLPTWESIADEANVNPLKAAAMMRLLNNFLRYHFQDNSVYVDNVPFSISSPDGGKYYEANFATAVINNKTRRFYETTVKSSDDNSTILVTDQLGRTAKVLKVGEEGKTWNLMSRDIELSAKLDDKDPSKSEIETSSFAVIQPIDRALLNDGLLGYDNKFCRYSVDGNLVDVMHVAGVDGSVTLEDGTKPFLVANVGEYEMKALDGQLKNMRVAYLMSPIDESNEAWNAMTTREQLVLKGEDKVLVNEEGMLVKFVKGADGTTVEYVTETTEDGSTYMIKVNNNGEVDDRIAVESTEAAN